MEEASFKEQRIRSLTSLYYSRQDIQKAIFSFSANRETVPRYFEGFGKRPDSLQYKGDIFELVKNGATSFHCSEELWRDALQLSTNMSGQQLNELRIGWDLLIDIDCKWLEYSKLATDAVIKTLQKSGIKNIGCKFSGSKGFHLIVPWKAFPKEINGIQTSSMFPEWPRIIIAYIRNLSEQILKANLPDEFYSDFKDVKIKKGVKCKNCNEIARKYNQVEFFCHFCKSGEIKKIDSEKDLNIPFCPNCRRKLEIKSSKEVYECSKCDLNSIKNKSNFISQREEIDLYDLMGLDLILVSSRHLFRAPYSLHEKTSLASSVIDINNVINFDIKEADPFKAKIKDFIPESKEGEAKELLVQALDWNKQAVPEKHERKEDFKPIKLEKISDSYFPPTIQKILQGVGDGRKRALFILLNLFRSIGMEKTELEKRIDEWNKKNQVPLKEGYIKAQLMWAYRSKPVLPPNFDKDYYKAIGLSPSQEEIRLRNPINYVIKKSQIEERQSQQGKKDKKER